MYPFNTLVFSRLVWNSNENFYVVMSRPSAALVPKEKFEYAKLQMLNVGKVARLVRQNVSPSDIEQVNVLFPRKKIHNLPAFSHNICFEMKQSTSSTWFDLTFGGILLTRTEAYDAWLIHLCKLKTNHLARKTIYRRKILLEKVLRRLLGVLLIVDQITALILWEEFDCATLCIFDKQASFQLKDKMNSYHSTPLGHTIPIHHDVLDHTTISGWPKGPFLNCRGPEGTRLSYSYNKSNKFGNEIQAYKSLRQAVNLYLFRHITTRDYLVDSKSQTQVCARLLCKNPHAIVIVCKIRDRKKTEPTSPVFSRVLVSCIDTKTCQVHTKVTFAEEDCRLFFNNYYCYVLPDMSKNNKNPAEVVGNTIEQLDFDHTCTGVLGEQYLQFAFETCFADADVEISILAFGVRMLAPNLEIYESIDRSVQ